MALVVKDRVRETSTTTGTGTITLNGAVTGFQGFSVIGGGNTTYYTIVDAATGDWEVGIGTYFSGVNTLSRTTVLESSNAGNLVDFLAGTRDVFCTYPAERSIYTDAAGSIITPATASTLPVVSGGSGATTLTGYLKGNGTSAFTASSTIPNTDISGLGTISTQNANSVAVTGGTIDGTTIGGSTAAAGTFTALGASGVATFSAGTASAPAITTTGDTNTGIFFPAADTIAFAEGGAEVMRLDSSGNVGIGTTSITSRLTIGGYSSADQTADIRISRSSSGTAIQAGPNITFADGTTNNTTALQVTQGRFGVWNYGSGFWSERMSIDSSGNLGLGVTPSAWNSSVRALETATGAFYSFTSGSVSNFYMLSNAYLNSSGTPTYKQSAEAAQYLHSAGQHQWFTAPSGTAGNAISFSQVMTLHASGGLSIGNTTDPGAKSLSVSGALVENVFTITDGAAFEIDPGNGTIQLITLGANRTPKATNFAAGEAITLMVDDGSAYAITWTDATWGGTGVIWETDAGVAPTLSTTGYTTIVLWKVGTQVYGARVGNA